MRRLVFQSRGPAALGLGLLGGLALGGCRCAGPAGEEGGASAGQGAGAPPVQIGSWRVLPGCNLGNGLSAEARLQGLGTRQYRSSSELAQLIKRHPLIDLPGVLGYSAGLCCYTDPRQRQCLMFALAAGADLRRFVATLDGLLADEDLGIELTVLRDAGQALPAAPGP